MDLRRKLTPEDLAAARVICDRVKTLVEARPRYIRDHALDPRVANPAANWSFDSDNPVHALFARVVECRDEVISNLRRYTQPFSGYHAERDAGAEAGPRVEGHARRFAEMTANLPRWAVCPMPDGAGECGVPVAGGVANADACNYQERVSLLYESGVLGWLGRKREPRVLEIGGGFGALAYHLTRIIPHLTYTIVDLPESLLFSALYLKLTRPDVPHQFFDGEVRPGFNFVANYLFDELRPPFDLAVNTLSMSEMSEAQVRHYAAGLARLLGEGGVFLEQNTNNKKIGFNYCKDFLPHYFPFSEFLPASRRSENGRADLWALRPVRGIVDPALMPGAPLQTKLLRPARKILGFGSYSRLRGLLGRE